VTSSCTVAMMQTIDRRLW